MAAVARMRLLLLLLCLAHDRALHIRPPIHRAAPPILAASAATSEPPSGLALYNQLQRTAEDDTPLGRTLARSLRVLHDAFRLYGTDRVVTSFNGGKDAVVVLHLSLAVLAAHNEETNANGRLRTIFFETDDEFPEIKAFVHETVAASGVELIASGMGFADGLRQCIDAHDSAAFVLGTRFGDPNANGQEDFSPSSTYMPPFMRVNPILTWSYHDVWAFLRVFELPYCALYDEGYTSLGKVVHAILRLLTD